MKRVRQISTLAVLKQLQQFYETRSQRKAFEESGAELSAIERMELEEFFRLIDMTEEWLRPPVKVNFGKKKRGR